jgi:hypothetical protein
MASVSVPSRLVPLKTPTSGYQPAGIDADDDIVVAVAVAVADGHANCEKGRTPNVKR